ncbi:hypothetical protein BKH11_03855 [Actinomyces naeslundii]|nr:hypothetical protein BKH11_03855 [Actinomyces naeslundii]
MLAEQPECFAADVVHVSYILFAGVEDIGIAGVISCAFVVIALLFLAIRSRTLAELDPGRDDIALRVIAMYCSGLAGSGSGGVVIVDEVVLACLGDPVDGRAILDWLRQKCLVVRLTRCIVLEDESGVCQEAKFLTCLSAFVSTKRS